MKATISKEVARLSDAKVNFLRQVGLSDHEIIVYELLVHTAKPMSAQEVAQSVLIFPNAVYRIFRSLESVGLARVVARRPIRYEAATQSQGFNAAYLHQKTVLESALLQTQDKSEVSHEQTYTVVGRQQMYNEYISLAQAAQKEIAVFAIGIAFSDELYDIQQQAIGRDVYIRHVIQQLQPDNYHVINKWQKLGVNLRYFKEERGFHLTLVDRSVALVTFSDPDNTDERFSVVTYQPFAVRMFQAQFESVWQQAAQIDKYK